MGAAGGADGGGDDDPSMVNERSSNDESSSHVAGSAWQPRATADVVSCRVISGRSVPATHGDASAMWPPEHAATRRPRDA